MNLKMTGIAVSAGIAVGEALVCKQFMPHLEEKFFAEGEEDAQMSRYGRVKLESASELHALCMAMQHYPQKAKIFTAQEDILNDIAIGDEIEKGIRQHRWDGSWAIHKAFSQFEEMLGAVGDPLIRERVLDLRDVKIRLLRNWFGVKPYDLSRLRTPVVIVAHELLPSDTAALNRENALAILTEIGGYTSHSAIIARSYGIPAVLGVENLLAHISSGDMVAVDAHEGIAILNPDPETEKSFMERRQGWLREQEEVKRYLKLEPLTADGVRVDVGLNIQSLDAEEVAAAGHTDFVGLFRTEFLYMERTELPDEEEQFQIYKETLQAFAPNPVTIRTLDIGGDKTAKCLPLPSEQNPFLGNRALRFCFSQPSIFRTQLRAALRASHFGELWLMLPMVGSVEDIRTAKKLIDQIKEELRSQGHPVSGSMKVGIMVEIPSIALIADLVAPEVDFASIGTNDLCQYLTAADRQNPAVAQYYQAYHPALFRVIGQVVDAFRRAGKPVSICGEMGSDILATKALVGLGLRKLSVGVSSVAAVKRALSQFSLWEAEQLALSLDTLPTAGDIAALLKQNSQ